jgi:hypothetical protein
MKNKENHEQKLVSKKRRENLAGLPLLYNVSKNNLIIKPPLAWRSV